MFLKDTMLFQASRDYGCRRTLSYKNNTLALSAWGLENVSGILAEMRKWRREMGAGMQMFTYRQCSRKLDS